MLRRQSPICDTFAPMNIDADRFRQIVTTVFGNVEPGYRDERPGEERPGETDSPLSTEDAEEVLAIARLAVDVDHHEDPDELALFNSISDHLHALGKIPTSAKVPTTPWENDDAKVQLRAHGAKLKGKRAGALAYVIAYLLTVADLQLDEAESELADELRIAVGLDEDRAAELVAAVSQIVTPPA
jgi:hypothetical protein